jgi:hypothetical protein
MFGDHDTLFACRFEGMSGFVRIQTRGSTARFELGQHSIDLNNWREVISSFFVASGSR